jgi:hypothetical protein
MLQYKDLDHRTGEGDIKHHSDDIMKVLNLDPANYLEPPEKVDGQHYVMTTTEDIVRNTKRMDWLHALRKIQHSKPGEVESALKYLMKLKNAQALK